MKKVGLITIGQSPRDDIVNNIRTILNDEYQIIEVGALDRVENPLKSEYSYLGGSHTGEIFVSRLRNGQEIQMDEHKILPLIEDNIKELKDCEANAMAIMCTGEYKSLEKYSELIRPYVVFHAFVDALFPTGKIGVIVPTAHQINLKLREWDTVGREVYVRSASPYDSIDKIVKVAKELYNIGVKCLLLDCLGFNINIKNRIVEEVDIPVILPGSLLAWVLRELA